MVTKESLEAVGLVGWPKTSGLARDPHQRADRAEVDVPARCGARRSRSPATWSGGRRRSRPRSGGRRSATASSSTTTRTRRTGRSRRPTPSGRCPDARVSTPLSWDEVPTVEAEAFTLATVPARFAAIGDPGRGDRRGRRVAGGPAGALAAARGGGPGRRAVAAELPQAGGRAAAGPAVAAAPGDRGLRHARRPRRSARRTAPRWRSGSSRRPSAARQRRPPGAPIPSSPTPTGRRRSNVPVIEISPGEDEGRGARGPRALEVDASRGRGGARGAGRPGRRHARPLVALVSGPRESHPRAGGRPPGAGGPGGRLRPVGRVRLPGPLRPARAGAATKGAGSSEARIATVLERVDDPGVGRDDVVVGDRLGPSSAPACSGGPRSSGCRPRGEPVRPRASIVVPVSQTSSTMRTRLPSGAAGRTGTGRKARLVARLAVVVVERDRGHEDVALAEEVGEHRRPARGRRA